MKRVFLIMVIALVLSGCNKKSGTADLRSFTKNAYKDRQPQIEPLPALKPVAVFIYKASNQKDPFNRANLKIQKPRQDNTGGGAEGPDLTRRKEPLEAYPTDALKMVGVMAQNGINWAIVRAPDKTVHRVTEGNYLGRNYGEIIRLKGNRMQVQELIKNPIGKWEKKVIKLVLRE